MTTANLPATDAASPTTSCELQHVTRDEWIKLASEFRDHSYRHCWDYATMLAARSNATVEHVAVIGARGPIGLASVRVKRLPGLKTGIAYVAGAPLVRHIDEAVPTARLESVLASVVREYVGRRKLVVRMAPTIAEPAWSQAQDECYRAASFNHAEGLKPYRTMVIDISRALADVRAGLAQKWRNSLNKAERQAIRIVEGHAPVLFEEFTPLFDELVARKSFDAPLGPDFYAKLQPQLPEAERLHIAIAWVGDEPAAGVVASLHGDTAVYLLGASNHVGRQANAAYLLQWKVIEAAAEQGCRWYDLGGVDAEANPGVYKFKSGMGGRELTAPGPYELAPSRVRGAAVRAAERAFRAAASRRAG